MINASAPTTPPIIGPTGGDDEIDEVEPLGLVLDVGVILTVNVVVMTDGILEMVSSMRSIMICELPGDVPRESAIFLMVIWCMPSVGKV